MVTNTVTDSFFSQRVSFFLIRAYSAPSLFGEIRAYSAGFELIRPLNKLPRLRILLRAYSANFELIRRRRAWHGKAWPGIGHVQQNEIFVGVLKYWTWYSSLFGENSILFGGLRGMSSKNARWISSLRKSWVCVQSMRTSYAYKFCV